MILLGTNPSLDSMLIQSPRTCGGFGAVCHIPALPDHTHWGFRAKPRVLAVPGPTGTINPDCALPVISDPNSMGTGQLQFKAFPQWLPQSEKPGPEFWISPQSQTSPRHLSEPSLTCPPRTQSSLEVLSSPSRNIRNSLNVLPSSKSPTLSLPQSWHYSNSPVSCPCFNLKALFCLY